MHPLVRLVAVLILLGCSAGLAAGQTNKSLPSNKSTPTQPTKTTQPTKSEPKPKTQEEKEAEAAAGAGGLMCCGFSGAVLIVGIILVSVVSLAFGFLPIIIAVKRGHPNTAAIVAVNLLLGWSFIGWVAALVWSITAFDSPRSQSRSRQDDDDDRPRRNKGRGPDNDFDFN